MKDLRKKTESGIKWSVIDQITRLSLSILISIFLARLIAPSSFGLFAMVTVFFGFLNVFKDFGLGAALIQKKNIIKSEIDSLFWISNCIGLLIGVAIYFSAPLIVEFYEEPKLLNITKVMSLIFFIGSTGLVPEALIRKSMDFKAFFYRNISNNLISGLVAIYFAYLDYGVWALVIQKFLFTFLGVFIGFRMISWRPSFNFSWKESSSFMRFSLPLLGENSINYWVRNIDNLIIGKFLGQELLGYYSKAYSLMLLPVRQISGSITRVIFPSFSIVQENKKLVWKNYLKLLSITSFITFPLMGYLFLMGDEIIYLLYGEEWSRSADIFKGLCFLGAIQSIGVFGGSIFSSQGRTFLQFKIGLVVKPLMLFGIIAGLYLGDINGLIIGYTLTSSFGFFIESFYVAKILGQKLRSFVGAIYKEFLITFLTLAICYFVSNSLSFSYDIFKMVFNGILGVILYGSLAYALKLSGFKFFKIKLDEIKKNR